MSTSKYDIDSPKNPRLKAAEALGEAKERRRTGLFAVEGDREIERALRSGYVPTESFACPDVLSPAAEKLLPLLQRVGAGSKTVAPRAFAKLAMRESAGGLVVIFKQKTFSLEAVALGPLPLILAAEGVEKPGNLGALLRSADGVGAAMLATLGASVDAYNPNSVRASLGTVFSVPVVATDADAFVAFCRGQKIQIVAALLAPESRQWHCVDFKKPTAILLGSEKDGLSAVWRERADHLVQLPMLGVADSLNVAAAGAALLYEALRQRST